MNRREFITLLGGAGAWPVAAHAQQAGQVQRIGMLTAATPADDPDGRARLAVFLQALQQLGWTEGHNVRIDYRWGLGDANNIRKYAMELAALSPDVILSVGTASMGALLQVTRTVPIVFVSVADPVGAGFVDSLSRPGGNATGFTQFEYSLSGKWLELLKQIAPGMNAGGSLSGSGHNLRHRPIRRSPIRGPFRRGGGKSDQCARRRRNRARRRGFRAFAQWRPDRDVGRGVGTPPRADHRACGPIQTARGVLPTLFCHQRRLDFLWV